MRLEIILYLLSRESNNILIRQHTEIELRYKRRSLYLSHWRTACGCSRTRFRKASRNRVIQFVVILILNFYAVWIFILFIQILISLFIYWKRVICDKYIFKNVIYNTIWLSYRLRLCCFLKKFSAVPMTDKKTCHLHCRLWCPQ